MPGIDYRKAIGKTSFTNRPGGFLGRPKEEVFRLPAPGGPSDEEAFGQARQSFADILNRQFGFNPVSYNPAEEARKEIKENTPALIQHIFGPSATMETIRRDPEKMTFFQRQFRNYQKRILGEHTTKQKSFREEYDEAMQMWERDFGARRGARPGYTPQQLVDDTRAYYNQKARALMNDVGYVREGSEDAYNNILTELDADLQTVGRGERPGWLTGIGRKKILDAETARHFLQEAGGDIKTARQLATDKGYTF